MHAPEPPRRHGALMAALLVGAVLLTLGAAIAIWLDRQALSDRGWRDTSVQLIENPQVRTAVADEMVTQLFTRAQLDARLSGLLGPLAPAAEHELRSLATRLAVITLATGTVKRAWGAVNGEAHRQLVASIERDHGRDVYLQLAPLVNQLLATLASSPTVAGLPAVARQVFAIRIGAAGQVRILRADQVDTARTAINAIRRLAPVLSALAAICFGLAIVVARGRRRRAVAYVGAGLIVCGGLLLIARAVVGAPLANALVPASAPANRAAVRAIWTIGSTQLRTEAIIALIAGAGLLSAGAAAELITTWRRPAVAG